MAAGQQYGAKARERTAFHIQPLEVSLKRLSLKKQMRFAAFLSPWHPPASQLSGLLQLSKDALSDHCGNWQPAGWSETPWLLRLNENLKPLVLSIWMVSLNGLPRRDSSSSLTPRHSRTPGTFRTEAVAQCGLTDRDSFFFVGLSQC